LHSPPALLASFNQRVFNVSIPRQESNASGVGEAGR